MNSEEFLAAEKARKLAERVVGRLNSAENSPDDSSSLRQIIEKFDQRLTNIESQLNPAQPNNFHPSQSHPSQEKFNLTEAVVEEMVGFFEREKACQFEPDKPCDKCAMCSSRGF